MVNGTEAGPRVQYAALPYRLRDGRAEILLIRSRETRRWVIPKGWPMRGLKPHKAAAREAYEEAGVVGRSAKRAIGRYGYGKRLPDGSEVPCQVDVYPLSVKRLLKRFPERGERGRGSWLPADEAAGLVAEPDLAGIIAEFARSLNADPEEGTAQAVGLDPSGTSPPGA